MLSTPWPDHSVAVGLTHIMSTGTKKCPGRATALETHNLCQPLFNPLVDFYKNLHARGKQKYMEVCKRHKIAIILPKNAYYMNLGENLVWM